MQSAVFVCNGGDVAPCNPDTREVPCSEPVPAPGSRVKYRAGVIAAAVALALVPVSEDVVEQLYSAGVYPWIQAGLTSASNLVPVALLDVLIVAVLLWTAAGLWRDTRRRRWSAALPAVGLRAATVAAALYVAFLLTWGLNYRRVPLEAKLDLQYGAVTPAAAEHLAEVSVTELNRLWPRRPAAGSLPDASLPGALGTALRRLGAPRSIVPGRPKRSLLDPYFRAASVDGMTDPYFLETLTLGSLLPVEQPFVVAHEWAHLAGYADEGEAGFVGWLACLSGDAAAQYSGWLALYMEVASGLSPPASKAVARRLDEGPRSDVAAVVARAREGRNATVAAVGWGIYDQYLRANGVEQGTRSYTDVVRLVLGTALGTGELARVSGAAPAVPPAPPAAASAR